MTDCFSVFKPAKFGALVILPLITVVMAGHTFAATPSPAKALALKPVQRDVDYEIVPPNLMEQCSVSDIQRPGWSGWEVVAPDGSVLRRFADTNDDKKVDLWSYFKFGVEVYRDIDDNQNGKADQYRWLSTGGIR